MKKKKVVLVCLVIAVVAFLSVFLVSYFTKDKDIEGKFTISISGVDGVLASAEYEIDGSSGWVYSQRLMKDNNLEFTAEGQEETVYVTKIGELENGGEYGPMSGWMYMVNNDYPSVGIGQYYPKDGDVIEWVFYYEEIIESTDTSSSAA